MPLLPFDEVLSPDKLVEGKVKLNTTLELIRLYVNSLTPEQVNGLIVGGKINPTYLEAFLTSVSASDVTFSSLNAGFTSGDVAAALDSLYGSISSSVAGSTYLADDGRTLTTTIPTVGTTPATFTASLAIGESAQVIDSLDALAIGSGSRVSLSNAGIAIGDGAWVTSTSPLSMAFGQNSFIEASPGAVQLGYGGTTDAVSDDSTALGGAVLISNSVDSVSVGILSSVFNSAGAISMGWGATVNTGSTSAIAITPGYGLMQASPDGIGIGHTIDMRDSSGAIAVGAYSSVRETGQGSIAIGEFAQVRNTSASAVAIGQYASIIQTSPSSIAIGNSADVRYSTRAINISNDASTVTYSNYSVLVSTDGFSNVRGTTGFPNSSVINSIFGGQSSEIITSDYSTIMGSGTATITNAYLGLIVGVESGVINGANGYAGIIGGVANEITGVANNNYIFGGSSNEILTDAFQAVVLGGSYNKISGDAWFRAILGGESNIIDGNVVEYVGISPSSRATYSRRSMEFVLSGTNSVSADLNRSGAPNAIRTGGKASSMQMLVRTIDATPTYLQLYNANHVPLLNRTATGFKVYLMASNFNAAANESAYWEITFATDVRNGVARLLGTPVINELHKDVPAWDVVVSVETIAPVPTDPQAPFANARIQVTGEAAKNITWSARVDISEIDF